MCRFISNGQRDLSMKYNLKTRKYIGPTSTCAELSFLMANQALVHDHHYNPSLRIPFGLLLIRIETVQSSNKNEIDMTTESLVWDPFCGTGSILIASTALGGHCVGMLFIWHERWTRKWYWYSCIKRHHQRQADQELVCELWPVSSPLSWYHSYGY